MKTIIAGSRTISDYELIYNTVLESKFVITEVVSGGARGVDKLGESWAKQHGVPIKLFLPNWTAYGKSAGIKRNQQMKDYADGLIAIWDGQSKGTKNMIDSATKAGLKVFVKTVE